MQNATVTFGKPNPIVETRTPIHVEFEGRRYNGLVLETPNLPLFIKWNSKVPDHIRHSSTGFLFEFTKQKVEATA